jgi:hypothetical protein
MLLSSRSFSILSVEQKYLCSTPNIPTVKKQHQLYDTAIASGLENMNDWENF